MSSKIVSLLGASALFAGCLITTAAYAEPSCTNWMDQGNGTSWRECVNDDGSQHCYLISNAPGSTAYEVKCQ